ncbi:hypothetical protein HDV00_007815 [Rhizophlyctis rosea]|nr:hypothetical protein HDV00_007815 [Rhizophlyctis rosea]
MSNHSPPTTILPTAPPPFYSPSHPHSSPPPTHRPYSSTSIDTLAINPDIISPTLFAPPSRSVPLILAPHQHRHTSLTLFTDITFAICLIRTTLIVTTSPLGWTSLLDLCLVVLPMLSSWALSVPLMSVLHPLLCNNGLDGGLGVRWGMLIHTGVTATILFGLGWCASTVFVISESAWMPFIVMFVALRCWQLLAMAFAAVVMSRMRGRERGTWGSVADGMGIELILRTLVSLCVMGCYVASLVVGGENRWVRNLVWGIAAGVDQFGIFLVWLVLVFRERRTGKVNAVGTTDMEHAGHVEPQSVYVLTQITATIHRLALLTVFVGVSCIPLIFETRSALGVDNAIAVPFLPRNFLTGIAAMIAIFAMSRITLDPRVESHPTRQRPLESDRYSSSSTIPLSASTLPHSPKNRHPLPYTTPFLPLLYTILLYCLILATSTLPTTLQHIYAQGRGDYTFATTMPTSSPPPSIPIPSQNSTDTNYAWSAYVNPTPITGNTSRLTTPQWTPHGLLAASIAIASLASILISLASHKLDRFWCAHAHSIAGTEFSKPEFSLGGRKQLVAELLVKVLLAVVGGVLAWLGLAEVLTVGVLGVAVLVGAVVIGGVGRPKWV